MPTLDLPLLIMLLLALLLVSALVLFPMTVVAYLLMHQLRNQKQSMTSLLLALREQQDENQLLRSQLRSPDLPTLQGMVATTTPGRLVSEDTGPYREFYSQEVLDREGLIEQGITDDLTASGWQPVFADESAGGTPITIE